MSAYTACGLKHGPGMDTDRSATTVCCGVPIPVNISVKSCIRNKPSQECRLTVPLSGEISSSEAPGFTLTVGEEYQ